MCPFLRHVTGSGRSPFITEHVNDARSPTFNCSMDDGKGFSFGGTGIMDYCRQSRPTMNMFVVLLCRSFVMGNVVVVFFFLLVIF